MKVFLKKFRVFNLLPHVCIAKKQNEGQHLAKGMMLIAVDETLLITKYGITWWFHKMK